MLSNTWGKLLVYAPDSSFKSREERVTSVSIAAEKIARFLNLSFEVVTFEDDFDSVYVYYKDGDEEPIPLYRDKDRRFSVSEICTALRSMMFVLSFHPRHSGLRRIRKEIMRFS
jgi:hypothetical protein